VRMMMLMMLMLLLLLPPLGRERQTNHNLGR